MENTRILLEIIFFVILQGLYRVITLEQNLEYSKLYTMITKSFPFMDFVTERTSFYEAADFINGNSHSVCNMVDNISDCMTGNTRQAVVLFPRNNTMIIRLINEISIFNQKSHHHPGITWTPYILIVLPEKTNFSIDHHISATVISGLSISSEIYFIKTDENNATNASGTERRPIFNIQELYSLKNATFINEVSRGNFIEFTTIFNKCSRRSNFQNVSIVGISVDDPGYGLATDYNDDNSTVMFIGGFEVEQFWFLRDAMNFSELASKSTGYIREGPNGTLTGMAVEINTGIADVVISSVELLEYRAMGKDGLTYLYPTFRNQIIAFFKQPPASSIRDVFISAFTTQLWICVLLMWIFVNLTINAFGIIAKRYFAHNHWKDEEVFEENFIMVFGMCCQQGWHISPSAIPLRIVFFFGWFLGLLCYIGYSAALVSILAIEVVPIHSFSDILKEKFFIYSDGHIPTTKFIIKELEDKSIIPKLPESLRNIDVGETIRLIAQGKKCTVVTTSDSFYPIFQQLGYTDNFACSVLSKVSVSPRPVSMGMAVKRGSPLRKFFNYKILCMQQSGINHRLMNNFLTETKISCVANSGGFQISLGIKDIFTAIGLLCSGCAASLVFLIVEKAVARKYRTLIANCNINDQLTDIYKTPWYAKWYAFWNR